MKTEYYTPTIEEFHVGFEYEMKTSFCDGTVKSQADYDKAVWEKRTSDSAIMYVERTLLGRKMDGVPMGIRVKHLTKEDIESLGWKPLLNHTINPNNSDYLIGEMIMLSVSNNFDNSHCTIIAQDDTTLFLGVLKNKSELKVIMKQLGI